jgi:spermidine synthase
MTRPWQTIDRVETQEGTLELRQRGVDDFLITVAGRVLMTSLARRSEEALATVALGSLERASRVLIGGLGMGYTLRAALDALTPTAEVRVAELSPAVIAWCRGPLAALTGSAVDDRRVNVIQADVAQVITDAAAGAFDAVLLDLYEGPHAATQAVDDPLYGAPALRAQRRVLRPGGVLGVWSEEPDRAYEQRLSACGFRVERKRRGGGGRAHTIYLGYT